MYLVKSQDIRHTIPIANAGMAKRMHPTVFLEEDVLTNTTVLYKNVTHAGVQVEKFSCVIPEALFQAILSARALPISFYYNIMIHSMLLVCRCLLVYCVNNVQSWDKLLLMLSGTLLR